MTDATIAPCETIQDLLSQLGGIEPVRIRLNPPPGTATEADLIAVNARKLGICELIDGTLVEKGMGYTESNLAIILGAILWAFVRPRNLGLITGESGMMRLFPGQVRVPDLAFASWDRIPGRKRPEAAIAGFAPDLAVEILSRSNTRAEMTRQRSDDFAAGVRLVWEVDPRARTVAVSDSPDQSIILDATMTLDGGAVLPGFALPLADLFAELDRDGT